jgi:Xaa-Pro aminopeptidase
MLRFVRSRIFCGLFIFLFVAGQRIATWQTGPLIEYKSRRKKYSERIKEGVTVIFNAPDEELHEYITDKNFYYLTGLSEPEGILVLSPSHPTHKETLFIPKRDPTQEKWSGPRLEVSPEVARSIGVDRLLSLDNFEAELDKLAASERKVYTALPKVDDRWRWSSGCGQVDRLRRRFPSSEIWDATPHIAFFRMKKSESELSFLRKAIQLTVDGQRAAAGQIRIGRFEYEVEATLEFEFRRKGASRPGFPSIVGSGANAMILHYDKNTREMRDGDLVVVDAGAEYGGYTADITRTYPVSGRFSSRQKEIYDIVLAAQEAALEQVKVGAMASKEGAIHRAAYDYINTHGKDLKGGSLGRYFTHGTSHHLGLDVHDVVDDPNRPLEPGMVISVEPGVYIPEENIGIRIEDNVLVTESGYELLSKDLPRQSERVEAMMSVNENKRIGTLLEWYPQ